MSPSKSRVFISFVHEDQNVASALQGLIAKELTLPDQVFLSADPSQVLAGDIWLDKLREALDNCEVLIMLISARALKRPWVNFEAGAIWLARKPVIPVCIGHASKNRLPHPYSGMQVVALPEDDYYLLRSLQAHLNLTTPPPSVLRNLMSDQEAQGRNYWHRLLYVSIDALQDEQPT